MTKRGQALRILGGVALLQILLVRDAQAYVDPGTGSLIFQVIIATVVGVGAAVRLYWERIKTFLSRTPAPEANRTHPGDADDDAQDPRERG